MSNSHPQTKQWHKPLCLLERNYCFCFEPGRNSTFPEVPTTSLTSIENKNEHSFKYYYAFSAFWQFDWLVLEWIKTRTHLIMRWVRDRRWVQEVMRWVRLGFTLSIISGLEHKTVLRSNEPSWPPIQAPCSGLFKWHPMKCTIKSLSPLSQGIRCRSTLVSSEGWTHLLCRWVHSSLNSPQWILHKIPLLAMG